MSLGADFIVAFRAGEEHAFDQVFRTYYVPLTYYANKFVHDEAMAEDIVQDCFEDLWKKRNKLYTVDSVNSYLYKCVFTKSLRYLKRLGKKVPDITDNQVIQSVEETIVAAEVLNNINSILNHLPPRMQQVLRMYYMEEKTCAEIGREIGIDPETVRSHRYRAILLLRKTIIPG